MWELSSIQVTEGSVTEPVTLDEIKEWLDVDFTDHDSLLSSMGKGARQSIENYCSISLVEKSVTLDLEVSGEDRVPMPYTSALSNPVVTAFDSQDVETTLVSGTDFFVRGNMVRIGEGRYTVTYDTVPGTIPEDIKEAIKMEVAERYANRGENLTTSGLSRSAMEKLTPYRIIWL